MVCEKEGNRSVIVLPQTYGGKDMRALNELLKPVLSHDNPVVVIDFRDTDMIDSAGIGSLVAAAKDIKSAKGTLAIRNLNAGIEELFLDADLDKIFAIETEEGFTPPMIDLFQEPTEIKLDISIDSRDGVYIMHLGGVMNHPVGSQLLRKQFLLGLAAHRKVLLDFEELTFFDSLSVSVVLSMNKLLQKTGGSLRICGANCIVDDLFNTLNIDQIIPFYHGVPEALREWTISP